MLAVGRTRQAGACCQGCQGSLPAAPSSDAGLHCLRDWCQACSTTNLSPDSVPVGVFVSQCLVPACPPLTTFAGIT